MARLVFDENVQIRFLATAPVDLDEPTPAEVSAGVNVTSFVKKDGLKFGVSNNRVTSGDISTSFTSETMGTWGAQASLDCYKDDTTDTAWTTFQRGTTGVLVVLPFIGATTTPANDHKCYAIPIECGQPVPMDSAENENQAFTVELAVTSTPDFNSTVTT